MRGWDKDRKEGWKELSNLGYSIGTHSAVYFLRIITEFLTLN